MREFETTLCLENEDLKIRVEYEYEMESPGRRNSFGVLEEPGDSGGLVDYYVYDENNNDVSSRFDSRKGYQIIDMLCKAEMHNELGSRCIMWSERL